MPRKRKADDADDEVQPPAKVAASEKSLNAKSATIEHCKSWFVNTFVYLKGAYFIFTEEYLKLEHQKWKNF